MTVPLDKPKSLDEAIDLWNRKHRNKPEEVIKPGSIKMNALGTDLLIHHTPDQGFWIEEPRKERPVSYFFSKLTKRLHLSQSSIPLTEPQQKEIAAVLRTYEIAARALTGKSYDEILEINTARVRAFFGEECAQAYSILMNPKANDEEIKKIRPKLEELLKKFERRAVFVDRADLVNNFEELKEYLKKEVNKYYKSLRTEKLEKLWESSETVIKTDPAKGLALGKQYLLAKKTDMLFKFYLAKLLDFWALPPRLSSFVGLNTNKTLPLILADLQTFQKDKAVSLTKENEQKLVKAINELEIANHLIPQNESEINALADKVHQHLLAFPKKDTQPIGSMILYGGFSTHAVLYQIEFDEKGGKFSIINTGAGAQHISHKLKKRRLVGTARDVVYSGNLNLSDLSPQFFEGLLMLGEKANDMEKIFAFLDKSLLREGVTKGEGQTRVLQKKGTCVVRCVHAWLLEKFGKELFREYDVFGAERIKISVEEEAKKLSPAVLECLFPHLPGEEPDEKFYANILKDFFEYGDYALQRKKDKIRRITV